MDFTSALALAHDRGIKKGVWDEFKKLKQDNETFLEAMPIGVLKVQMKRDIHHLLCKERKKQIDSIMATFRDISEVVGRGDFEYHKRILGVLFVRLFDYCAGHEIDIEAEIWEQLNRLKTEVKQNTESSDYRLKIYR